MNIDVSQTNCTTFLNAAIEYVYKCKEAFNYLNMFTKQIYYLCPSIFNFKDLLGKDLNKNFMLKQRLESLEESSSHLNII